MRVLMVTEDIPAPQVGGLGKHVVTLANTLIASGHDVDLLGRNDKDYASCSAEIGFNGRFIPGFDLARTGWKEAQLGVFIPGKRPHIAKRIANAIMRHAKDYDVIHYHGHLPMVGRYIPESVNFLQTRHDQGGECLTHTRFLNGNICETTDASNCAKCIHSAPGKIRSSISAAAVRRYRQETSEGFAKHKTIFVSDFLRQQFVKAAPFAKMDKTKVIHNFIDLDRLRNVLTEKVEVRTGSVLLAGRIDQSKGMRAFLEEATLRMPPGVTIDIVGDGPDRLDLERRYSSEVVRFFGWRAYNEVIIATSSAHVCVVPSIWQEPCGTTILEALAIGRPCVALARGGTPELACYQRYPGQLVLAADMAEMVSKTFQVAVQSSQPVLLPDYFGADVNETLPTIIEAYSA